MEVVPSAGAQTQVVIGRPIGEAVPGGESDLETEAAAPVVQGVPDVPATVVDAPGASVSVPLGPWASLGVSQADPTSESASGSLLPSTVPRSDGRRTSVTRLQRAREERATRSCYGRYNRLRRMCCAPDHWRLRWFSISMAIASVVGAITALDVARIGCPEGDVRAYDGGRS